MVKGRPIIRIQCMSLSQPIDQVRVGDEVPPKNDQLGVACFHLRSAVVAIEATCAQEFDASLLQDPPQRHQRA